MIGIVILNYNNYEVTQDCVTSIITHEPSEEYRIFIVDNGSKNDSVEVLSRKYKDEERVVIEALPENGGFAVGNNKGIDLCVKNNINECILSNSDILFLDGSIDRMIDDVRKEDVVIAGPKIVNSLGVGQHSSRLNKGRIIDPLEIGRFFPQKMIDENVEKGIKNVFSVSGCCFAVNIAGFREMGAFDEGTFLYNEENILGMQAQNARKKIVIDLDTTIIHNHGSSTGGESDFIKGEYIKSTLYYWHKYRNKNKAMLKTILNVFVLKEALKNNNAIHPLKIKSIGEEYIERLISR